MRQSPESVRFVSAEATRCEFWAGGCRDPAGMTAPHKPGWESGNCDLRCGADAAPQRAAGSSATSWPP